VCRTETTFPLGTLFWSAGLVAWLLLAAPLARADELGDFESARGLYEKQDYAGAVEALRRLVGTDPPRIGDPLLVLESRKYLAASLLFMGAVEDAKAQFRLVLSQEPRYTLDPLGFPTDVLKLFDEVKADLRHELDQRRRLEDEARRKKELDAEKAEAIRRENLARLKVLAAAAEVQVDNSRWVASIPFGVGQFQNGHRGLGVALAMFQGLAAVGSVASFIGHERLANEHPSPAEVETARREEAVWRKVNYVSFGTFLGLAVIGLADAHLRFVPSRVIHRPRQLPADLERWLREQEPQK
jgi:hypothetical protein